MPTPNIEFYNAALDALEAGQLEPARQAIENALVEDAKDAESWKLYILILNALGRTNDAEAATRKLSSLGISETESLVMQADAAIGRHDYAEAVTIYQQVASLEPQESSHALKLAMAQMELGNADLALEAAMRGVDLAPEDPNANYLHGRILRLAGRKAEAMAALTKALHLDPEFMMAVYEQGMLLAETGEPEAALANFEKFLIAHPGDPAATQAIAAIRQRISQTR